MGWGRKSAAYLMMSALAAAAAMPAAAAAGTEAGASFGKDRVQAIECMTNAILYEAGFEPREGQEAVAEVVLNRLRNPAFPKTVCGVIFQGSQRRSGCQFSFTCDGSLRKTLPFSAMTRAREVATRAIDGQLAPHTSGATYYHANYILPYWAPTLVRVASIGRHIFYRQPGGREFSQLARYDASGEQNPGLAGVAGEASAEATTAPSQTPREQERFLPWGLAPQSPAQSQSVSQSGGKP